jgi:hypothetical protein
MAEPRFDVTTPGEMLLHFSVTLAELVLSQVGELVITNRSELPAVSHGGSRLTR